jgi:hypothetical protein
MFDKLDVISKLKRDDYYKKLLAMAPEQDRERIEKIVEQFIMSVQNPMLDLGAKIQQSQTAGGISDEDLKGKDIIKD